jgi:hypothetical protein
MKNLIVIDSTPLARGTDPNALREVPLVAVDDTPAAPVPAPLGTGYDPLAARAMPDLVVVSAEPRVVHYPGPEPTEAQKELMRAREKRSILD